MSDILDTDSLIATFLHRHQLKREVESELYDLLETAMGAYGTLDDAPTAERALPITAAASEDRYVDLGMIGSGASSEVRRVRDRRLERVLAMKILRPERIGFPTALARFQREIRIPSLIQHPGIVSVFDHGTLPDGRPWFTMQEVRGQPLDRVIASHRRQPPDALRLRRLIDTLMRIIEATAYAHSLGVIHRDLKPANLMIGSFGEVLILDWGIARRLSEPETVGTDEPTVATGQTRHGAVLGTPRYMAPEQASGDLDRLGLPTDVYALGGILSELLNEQAPDELIEIAQRAQQPDPAARYPDASHMAADLRDWLEGARRRARALASVEKAGAMEPEIQDHRDRAARLRSEAEDLLRGVQPFDPVATKAPGWTLQDEAEEAERAAEVLEATWLQTLRAAISLDPTLPAPHDRLAAHYRDRMLEAEQRQDRRRAAALQALLTAHNRGPFTAFLEGHAAITLVTQPAGAQVTLHRYETRGRRRIAEPVADLGCSPILRHTVPHGSYLLTATLPGFAPLCYPVFIQRGEHWEGCAPGTSEPRPIRMLPTSVLSVAECHVPAGWFIAGGDPEAAESLPRARWWLEDFAIDRFPVTNTQYIAFLEDLLAQDREDEALQHAPRSAGQSEDDHLLYARSASGGFTLQTDPDGRLWLPDWPVTMITWHSARAYATWRARQTGQPWRLPMDYEWAKAARGGDGRAYPWGDYADPTWARMVGSSQQPNQASITECPIDVSPYGVRGMGGNVRDWCLNAFQRGGPVVRNGLPKDAIAEGESLRSVRGGCWASTPLMCRSGIRFAGPPQTRFNVLGFRLVRSLS
ncbi:MAG: sulfatase activating formylglycine-generating enzyme [Myxococcota bacterium]|jgi:formylglycine-generating enzyme required for sulfatase activity/tRNA A-37 threonylcarbamoyl transferase component Bud32